MRVKEITPYLLSFFIPIVCFVLPLLYTVANSFQGEIYAIYYRLS